VTVADRLVAALVARGVDTVFGFPSEQMEPYYAALAGSDLRHVHPRSEASAALMADGSGVAVMHHGPHNSVERVFQEVQRRPSSLSNSSSHVAPATAESWLETSAVYHDARRT
jgi:hypothetical protein